MSSQRLDLYTNNGMVVIEMENGNKLIFDPPVVVRMAHSMIGAAVECGYKVEIVAPRPQVTEIKRNNLVRRTVLVLKSLQKKDRLTVAQAVVDTILSEVL